MTQTITATLTEDDIVTANMIHVRPTSRQRLTNAAVAAGGLVLLATSRASELIFLSGIVLTTFGAVRLLNFFIIWPMLIPARARRLSQQMKSIHEPTEITWDHHNITFKAESWTATHPWTDFTKQREGDEHFLLYLNDYNSFRIVPKRCFNNETAQEDFTQQIQRTIKAD